MTSTGHALQILGIADDLSGAAETALLLGGVGSVVILEVPAPGFTDAALPAVTVVDLDTRYATADVARERVQAVLAGTPAGVMVFKKVDSLLRGNIAAELSELASGDRRVVLAPTLPELGRSVRNGIPLVHGVELAHTGLWRSEVSDPPARVADLFGDHPVASIPLETVRADRAVLTRAIDDAAQIARITIVDAESDSDLDRVVAATNSSRRNDLVLAGSRALAAAQGRLRDARTAGIANVGEPGDPVVIVGSADAASHRQFDELSLVGADTMSIAPAELLGDPEALVPRVVAALGHGHTLAIRIDPGDIVAPTEARRLAAALAGLVTASIRQAERDSARPLVILGGETARATLSRLAVDRLRLEGTAGRHAVVSTSPDGRLVITRPGSFGDDSDLIDLTAHLIGRQSPSFPYPLQEGTTMNNQSARTTDDARPVIGITMGDAAGVGPEVIVAALADPELFEYSRPVVIGDLARLREAAGIRGLDLQIVAIDSVADLVATPGRIDVIDLALLPADLAWGELSAVAGDAAFQYVREACRLAVDGQIDAICTAPLNKEALRAGGHSYPGHTELLAALTGTEEVSMMLSTPVVKVIHVTTHVGLIDAVARIEPGLVERTIRRGYEAMTGAGIAEPRIGVCAINPHAGEHGLFGYGEEEEKIAPGIEAARAAGIDARGPLPADTAFFLAGRGDYDLIVAMYHDQGHGPVKVLGIEAGTNITVGLPVIRTSVDHGTAFDIAGKGIADSRSMTEAIRQAAQLSVGSKATV